MELCNILCPICSAKKEKPVLLKKDSRTNSLFCPECFFEKDLPLQTTLLSDIKLIEEDKRKTGRKTSW